MVEESLTQKIQKACWSVWFCLQRTRKQKLWGKKKRGQNRETNWCRLNENPSHAGPSSSLSTSVYDDTQEPFRHPQRYRHHDFLFFFSICNFFGKSSSSDRCVSDLLLVSFGSSQFRKIDDAPNKGTWRCSITEKMLEQDVLLFRGRSSIQSPYHTFCIHDGQGSA